MVHYKIYSTIFCNTYQVATHICELYLQNTYMPFAIIHKRMIACLDMASGPFVRYLLELHIGRKGTSGIIISIFRATTRDEQKYDEQNQTQRNGTAKTTTR